MAEEILDRRLEELRAKEERVINVAKNGLNTVIDRHAPCGVSTKDLPEPYRYPPKDYRYTMPAGIPGQFLNPEYRCPSCHRRWYGSWVVVDVREIKSDMNEQASRWALHHREVNSHKDLAEYRWDWQCQKCRQIITVLPRASFARGMEQ